MENNRRENFEDLLKTVADLKSRLEELEMRIEEYRSAFGDSLQIPLPEEIEFEHEDFLGDMSELVPGGDEIRINADIPLEDNALPSGSTLAGEESTAAGDIPEQVPVPDADPAQADGPESVTEPGHVAEPESVTEPVGSVAGPEEPESLPGPSDGPEPAAEPEVTAAEELGQEESEDDEPFSLFGEMFGPAPVRKTSKSKTLNDANASRASGAVIDLKSDNPAWSVDMPGPEVKDVRSAISLNDRVMFISTLFREDSMLFQDVVGHINGMSDLGKVVAYLQATFPEWDMNSDSVYRFMMAVRRKIR